MGEGSVKRSLKFSDGEKLPFRYKVFSLIGAGLRKDLPSIFSILESLKFELPFTLQVLEQLSHDILMARKDSNPLIHLDLAEGLKKIAEQTGAGVWQKLAEGAHTLRFISNPGINLLFQVQTLLVDTFIGA